MDSLTLIVLGFLFLGYFIFRSMGENQKPQAEPPPLPPPQPTAPTRPPLIKSVKKKQPQIEPKIKKISRAASIRGLARKSKDWVIMNEVLKKKFPE
ncbi:MAG TPA: hypothetical protein DCE71_08515 [Parachlamydiales bacterium]|nr:hypothetical protein [Parachlamydiales bacterium]